MNAFLLSLGKVNLFAIYHDDLDYVAPVGNTAVSIGDAYASTAGMSGQNMDIIGKTKTVTQHGSLDAWFNSQTKSPSLLIEMPPSQTEAVINKHVDAIKQLVSGGGI
jgi:dolichol kinase